jgi:uncharacterized membrane protein YozB (DUF420 family)
MKKPTKKYLYLINIIGILIVIFFEIYIITDCVFNNQCFTRRTHYATPNDSTYWIVIVTHSILLICILSLTTFLMLKQFLKTRKVKIMREKYLLSRRKNKQQQ